MSKKNDYNQRMRRLEAALLSRNDSLFIQVLTEMQRLMDAGDNKGAHVKFTAKQKIQAGAILSWAALNDLYVFLDEKQRLLVVGGEPLGEQYLKDIVNENHTD